MIEIDGLKIERSDKNGQVKVTFPDGGWNGEPSQVANILLYEILQALIAIKSSSSLDKYVYDYIRLNTQSEENAILKKGKRGRTKT